MGPLSSLQHAPQFLIHCQTGSVFRVPKPVVVETFFFCGGRFVTGFMAAKQQGTIADISLKVKSRFSYPLLFFYFLGLRLHSRQIFVKMNGFCYFKDFTFGGCLGFI